MNISNRSRCSMCPGIKRSVLIISLMLSRRAIAHKPGSGISRGLSPHGLGSNIHLIQPIDNPFINENKMTLEETLPLGVSSSLDEEVAPAAFRTRQSYGGFSLPSVFLETDHHGSSFSELSALSTASMKQDMYLNRVVSSHPVEQIIPHVSLSANAVSDSIRSTSGETFIDFTGSCSEGYTPFEKHEDVESLAVCWSICRGNFACTQVHFKSSSGDCFLSQGISVRSSPSSSTSSECRSLTVAGVALLREHALPTLPSFTVLPNNQIKLVYEGESVPVLISDSLAECQSACLEDTRCGFGVWLEGESKECVLGSLVLGADSSCPNDACVTTCGSSECILFQRNVGDLVHHVVVDVPVSSAVPSSLFRTPSVSCEQHCGGIEIHEENACVTLCVAAARHKCQSLVCSHSDCYGGVVFTYGANEPQECYPFEGKPVGTATKGKIMEVFVPPRLAFYAISSGSLVEGATISSTPVISLLSTRSIQPQFATFNGACPVFHEGILLGSGVGISRFAAVSLDECWGLCTGFSEGECTQVQFNMDTSECTLGDAISVGPAIPNSSVTCRSFSYMPTTSGNGLPGIMFVDSVGAGQKNGYWFPDATEPQLVGSLEECQAVCKQADTGAADSVCRYAGYVECSSFHSTACASNGAAADCQLCDRNPSGGVCRIPRMVSVDTTTASVSPPAACLGNQCRWFEKSAPGFSLVVKTAADDRVDRLPSSSSGLICDGSYLPPSTVDQATSRCYFAVESLWHCQQSCVAVNRVEKSPTIRQCVGGLYTDNGGDKRCYLAQYLRAEGVSCTGAANCGWFDIDGRGKTASLATTGMELAVQARSLSAMPFDLGIGQCKHFKSFGVVITKPVSDLGAANVLTFCADACAYFPQCMAFQVDGSKTGGGGKDCNLIAGKDTDCSMVTCQLSSAITLPAAGSSNSTVCWSKTASATVNTGPEEIDMDGIDPGVPGFVLTNARVRRFAWSDVQNQNTLGLTPTMEDCQSLCRSADGCAAGTWQPCQAIESYCASQSQSAELNATCAACANVRVSDTQSAVAFPVNYGVCKLANVVGPSTQGCDPEPCYAFETADENFFIMSLTKSSFLSDSGIDTTKLNFRGESGAFTKAQTLLECQSHCRSDPTCKYGHFSPKSSGAGECYLTALEVRIHNGDIMQMKEPVKCDGKCVVFYKLPTTYPGA
jgi:hypothetical protein